MACGLARHDKGVTDLDDPVEHDETPSLAPAKRRRPDRGLLIASLVIAAGLTLIVWGFFSAITGDEGVNRPAEIESISPVENAVQVLQQEGIAVDLEFGYEAVLIVDGIELETTNIGELEAEPGQLLAFPPTAIFDPGNSIITFTPSDDAQITEFVQGRHQARVLYWRVDEGRDNARSYNWFFEVV